MQKTENEIKSNIFHNGIWVGGVNIIFNMLGISQIWGNILLRQHKRSWLNAGVNFGAETRSMTEK